MRPESYYRIYKFPPPLPILSQISPVHVFLYYLLRIHFNIIFPFTPSSSNWIPFLRFPYQNSVFPLLSPIRATYPAHLTHLDLITWLIFGKQYRSSSSSLYSFQYCPVTLSLLGPKYPPQDPIFKHPKTLYLPECERPIHANRQN